MDSQVSKTRFFKNVGLRSRRSSSTAGGPRSYGASHQTLDGVRSTENNEVSNAGAMEMDGEAEIVHGAAINDSNLTPTTLVPDVGLENRPQSLHQSPTPGVVSDMRKCAEEMGLEVIPQLIWSPTPYG